MDFGSMMEVEDEGRRTKEMRGGDLNEAEAEAEAGEEQACESKKRERATKTKEQDGTSRVHMLLYVGVKRRGELGRRVWQG